MGRPPSTCTHAHNSGTGPDVGALDQENRTQLRGRRRRAPARSDDPRQSKTKRGKEKRDRQTRREEMLHTNIKAYTPRRAKIIHKRVLGGIPQTGGKGEGRAPAGGIGSRPLFRSPSHSTLPLLKRRSDRVARQTGGGRVRRFQEAKRERDLSATGKRKKNPTDAPRADRPPLSLSQNKNSFSCRPCRCRAPRRRPRRPRCRRCRRSRPCTST